MLPQMSNIIARCQHHHDFVNFIFLGNNPTFGYHFTDSAYGSYQTQRQSLLCHSVRCKSSFTHRRQLANLKN